MRKNDWVQGEAGVERSLLRTVKKGNLLISDTSGEQREDAWRKTSCRAYCWEIGRNEDRAKTGWVT